MKKKLIFFTLLSLHGLGHVNAQTITLKPDSTGKDAIIRSTVGNSNGGHGESLTAYTWTNGGQLAKKRFLIEFDYSSIPSNATVTSAKLSFFYNPTDPYESFSTHSGANNQIYIQRIESAWDENTLTWNNQPSTSAINQINMPASTNGTQDYTNIDVTNLVNDMLDPSNGNHGFLVRMVDEVNVYKAVLFASGDHPVDSLHPELEITWEIKDNLSIEETHKNTVTFDVFPNPNHGNFVIELPKNATSDYTIEVYNTYGKLIHKEHISQTNPITINQKGLFFVKVQNSHGYHSTKQILVQ